MRCTRLNVRGLKGLAESSYDFDRVTVVGGPNAAGKTRILDALYLVVLGYRPGWLRGVDDVMASAAGDELVVEAEFDTDDGPVTVTRSWVRQYYVRGAKKGELKEINTPVTISTLPADAHQNKQQAEVRRLFGLSDDREERADQELVFDPASFLALTPDKRRASMFRLAAGLLSQHWDDETLKATFPKDYVEALDDRQAGEPVVSFVERLWTEADKDASDKEVRAKNKRAALRELTPPVIDPEKTARLTALESELPAARAAKVEALSRIAGDVAKAEASLEADRKQAVAIAEAGKRREALRAEIAALRSGAPVDAEGQRLRDAIAEYEAEVGPSSLAMAKEEWEQAQQRAETPPDSTAVDAALEEVRVKNAAVDEALAASQAAFKRSGMAVSAAHTANAAVEKWQAVYDRLTSGGPANPFDEPTEDQRCPTCRRPVDHDAIVALQQAIDEAKVEAEAAAVAADEAKSVLDSVGAAVQRASKDLDKARVEADDAKAAMAAVASKDRDAARNAYERWTDLKRKHEDLCRRLRVLEAGSNVDQRIGEIEGRIAELSLADETPPDTSPACDAAQEIQRLKAEKVSVEADLGQKVREMEAEREDLRILEQEHRKFQQLKRESDDATTAAKAARKKADAFGVRGLLGEVMAVAIDPFQQAVNAFLPSRLGAFKVNLSDPRGRPAFRLGLLVGDDDDFIPVETISGGEATTVRAGIALGLAHVSGLPWRPAFVDEFEGVDAALQPGVLDRIADEVDEGRADQALVLGCWISDGITTRNGMGRIYL